MCSGILVTTHESAQILGAEELLSFDTNAANKGVGLYHPEGSTTVTAPYKGIYLVMFEGDITPTASGATTISILNNDDVIATTSFTGATATVQHITLNGAVYVRPSCPAINNGAKFTVRFGVGATVTNATLIVERVSLNA